MQSVLALSCGVPPPPLDDTSHYRIDLDVRPSESLIRASVDLSFRSPQDGAEVLTFYLHRQLSLDTVWGEAVAGYTPVAADSDPPAYMPEARAIEVALSQPLGEGERIDLHFDYGGVVDAWPWWLANIIGGEWVELGLYLPWFPYNYGAYGPFTFSVDVTTERGYQVRSFGTADRTIGGWRLEWRRPVNDIVVVASRDLRTRRLQDDGYTVQVHFTTLGDTGAERIGRDALSMLRMYADWYGDVGGVELGVVQSRRAHGGGYTRPGLIVLGQLQSLSSPDQRGDYVRYLAHEAAHLWWGRAPATSWEDWLNESFAEYSALLVVRDMAGDAEYEARIARKRDQARGTIPIWGMERDDYSTDETARQIRMVLYNKGPVLLHELAARVGTGNFLAWCAELVRRRVSSTDQALDVLAALEGEATERWFREQLVTR